MEPHNQASYRAGQAVDSLTLVRALGELQRVSRRIVARWGAEIDVLVTPTLAILPPPAGSILRQVHEDPEGMPMDVLSMAAFTAPFNVSGQPAVSLPLHRADDGIPVGVQLVAGPWQEDLLVRLASQLEEADPWLDRHPPLDPS
jgi:amidase